MHENYMARALALAVENVRSGSGGPFAAVVERDGEIISEGTNLVTATNDPTAHAEIVAIRAACTKLGSFQLSGCTVYASCEPCPMCLAALYWARPDAVFYAASCAEAAAAGFDDSYIATELCLPNESRSLTIQQLKVRDALESFRLWSSSSAKVSY